MALVNNFSFGIRRQIIAVLCVLAFAGALRFGITQTIPQVVIAAGVALLTDLVLQYVRGGQKYFSETALISGLIVALVIDIGAPLPVVALASFFAVASKHLLRLHDRHIFNPASFGLVLTALFFPGIGHTWWGESAFLLALILGVMVAYRLFKLDLVLMYLLAFFVANALFNLWGGRIEFIWAEFTATISVFFLFFMLVEPQTSPSLPKQRRLFGIIAGIFSFIFLHFLSVPFLTTDAFLWGLLTANLATALYSKRRFFFGVAALLALSLFFQQAPVDAPTSTTPTQTSTSSIAQPDRIIEMVAKNFEFVPGTISVKMGETVQLKITSADVMHGFSLPIFDINETLPPHQEVSIQFTADQAGEFPFACSVQCGHGHATMRGVLVVE
jgi:cytochrome c oxidase subunit 2